MNILFISTSIPPYPDMQSIRNIFLIKGLERKGHKINIITTDYKWNQDDLDDKLSKETHIIRTKPAIFIRVANYLKQRKKLVIFNKLFNVLIHYIAIPDMHMFWNFQAKKYIKDFFKSNEKVDLVISSSGSYTAHILGAWIAHKYNIRWIAEYGDPWGLNSYGKIRKLNYLIEKNIMKLCKGMVFTTQSTIDAYSRIVKDSKIFSLVPCGYEEIIDDFYDKRSNENEINIGYIGVAYASSRNLMHAIECVNAVSGIKLHLIGSYSNKYKKQVEMFCENKVTFMGRVSYEKSIELISKMDVLLHIGNKGIMQVPGKTYIYLSSKKPIIYIQQEEKNDPTYEILKDFEGIIFCKNNVDEINRAFNELLNNYEFYKDKSIQRVNSKKIEKYKWLNIGNEFAEFVEQFYTQK